MPVEIDFRAMTRTPSTDLKIYWLFVLVACYIAAVKLLRIWKGAPPFRLFRQDGNPDYLTLLRSSCNSFMQWMVCLLLSWGIFASHTVARVCWDWLGQPPPGKIAILFLNRRLGRHIDGGAGPGTSTSPGAMAHADANRTPDSLRPGQPTPVIAET